MCRHKNDCKMQMRRNEKCCILHFWTTEFTWRCSKEITGTERKGPAEFFPSLSSQFSTVRCFHPRVRAMDLKDRLPSIFFHVGRVDSSFLGYLSELLTDRVPRSKYHGHGSKQKCCEANMPPNANLDLGSKLAAPLFQYPVLCLWPVEAQLHLAHPTHIFYMLWLHFLTIGIDHTDLVQNELRHLQNLCLRILPTKLLTQWSFRQKDHATIHAINVVTCHEKNLGSGPWHPFGVPPNQHN